MRTFILVLYIARVSGQESTMCFMCPCASNLMTLSQCSAKPWKAYTSLFSWPENTWWPWEPLQQMVLVYSHIVFFLNLHWLVPHRHTAVHFLSPIGARKCCFDIALLLWLCYYYHTQRNKVLWYLFATYLHSLSFVLFFHPLFNLDSHCNSIFLNKGFAQMLFWSDAA